MKPIVRAMKARPYLARRTLLSSMVLAAMLGSACSTTGEKDPFAGYDEAFSRGDYAAAAAALESGDVESDEKSSAERDVLRLLHRAEAQRLAGDYRGAIASYERAESGLKSIDTENTGERALEGAAALAGGKGDYEPYEAEKILINTYMALSYLSLGEDDEAGVQFRRADNRTSRAIDYFAEELAAAESQKLEVNGKSLGGLDSVMSTTTDNASLSDGSDEDVDTFAGYDQFMVPAASYLYGVYNMGLRDPSDADRAITAFRAVSESHEDVELFKQELSEAEAGRAPAKSTVWVVYENGRAPSLQEHKTALDVTVDLDSLGFAVRENGVDPTDWKNSMQASGLNPYVLAYAVPTQKAAEDAGLLPVADSTGNEYELSTFSKMGSVRETEFDRRRPAMVRTAAASAAIKVAAQAIAARELEEKAAGLGGFGARIAGNATAATTSADTRSWRSLPSHWEVARFARPADGTVVLDGTGVATPNWQRTLIYVKRPSANSPLRASIIDLDGRHEAIELGL